MDNDIIIYRNFAFILEGLSIINSKCVKDDVYMVINNKLYTAKFCIKDDENIHLCLSVPCNYTRDTMYIFNTSRLFRAVYKYVRNLNPIESMFDFVYIDGQAYDIKKTTGEIVYRLEDIPIKGKDEIEKMIKYFDENPEAEYYYTMNSY